MLYEVYLVTIEGGRVLGRQELQDKLNTAVRFECGIRPKRRLISASFVPPAPSPVSDLLFMLTFEDPPEEELEKDRAGERV